MSMGGLDTWRNDWDSSSEAEGIRRQEAAEREAEEELEAALTRCDALERENVRLRAAVGAAEDLSKFENAAIHSRLRRARKLVHEALLGAESGTAGMPLLALDQKLTEALALLGCAGCSGAIDLQDMQLLTYVRRTCCHATGDCVERAGAQAAKSLAVAEVRAALLGGV